MELRQLQYFVEVAKKQHITQAAEQLHVAQSAVSRQIHQLEGELGTKLFIPMGRNVKLSPAGKLFLKRIEAIFAELDKAVLEVQQFTDPKAGFVRLAFPHSIGVNLVPSIVAQFRKADHPKVQFRFKQGKFNVLIHSVLKGETDIALISPFPHDDHRLAGKVLKTEELFAILPLDHKLANEETIRLEQLKNEPFVLFSEGYSLRDIVWKACLEAGFKPNISFEGEETETIRGLVAAGMGVSLLPEMAIKDYLQPYTARVKVTHPTVSRTIGFVHRADEKLSMVVEVFRTYLLHYFDLKEDM